MKKSNNKVITLLTLFIIFIGPLIAAWWFYSDTNTWKAKKLNHGKLIQPVISVKKVHLYQNNGKVLSFHDYARKWLLIMVQPSQECNNDCKTIVHNLRQVHLALGKKSNRVRRLMISYQQKKSLPVKKFIEANYQNMEFFMIDKSQWINSLKNKKINLSQPLVFIIDPLGNLIMYYPADFTMDGLYKDLKRLL